MALGIAAYALFSLHDAGIKYLVSGIGAAPLPVWQVLFFRSVFIVVFTLVNGRTSMLARVRRTPFKAKISIRAMITLIAWICYYGASRQLPLAQLLTLYFASPIITTLLAAPVLGEKVPPSRWVSVGIGFCGVVVACDPGGIAFSSATALVLMAATFWGFGVILMRQISRLESSLFQMFVTNVYFMIATGTASILTWQPLVWSQIVLLLLIGALGAVGQFCLFEGARVAPASVMATVEYSALIWAFILGYFVFHDVPPPAVFLGAGLIATAGGLLVATERRRHHRLVE